MKTRMLLTVIALLTFSGTAHSYGPAVGGAPCTPCCRGNCMPDNYEEAMDDFRHCPSPGRCIKICDLVDIVGEERIKTSGFGVVTGLHGSGDTGVAAIKMLISVAERQGIRIELTDIRKKNVALVTISAEIDPYQRSFDVAVKSIGDDKSLQN